MQPAWTPDGWAGIRDLPKRPAKVTADPSPAPQPVPATPSELEALGPRLVTRRQAAAMLAVSERTLWGWTKCGLVPAIRLPGRGKKPRAIRYLVKDLERWIERTKERQTVPVIGPDGFAR
jgi:hypothetical protein